MRIWVGASVGNRGIGVGVKMESKMDSTSFSLHFPEKGLVTIMLP